MEISAREKWSLYLDDNRDPKTERDWTIARSVPEAKTMVMMRGCPSYISFDHDLGDEGTGHDFAKWLVEQSLDGKIVIPEDFQFNIHSANGVGSANIYYTMNGYLTRKDNL